MEDERGVMLISTSIRINDNMSSDEKKRAIQSIVKLVDIAILNNIENIAGAKPEHQIYLDESGINTNLTRHYAHAVYGKRAIDAAPINTPAGTTVLSSIRLNGSLVYTTYQGGTTAQRFREYMKEQLIPSLEKDDVVIMDNMRSHHAKIVTELMDKSGSSYLYLPPYSPDLNPVEKCGQK